MGPTSNKDFSSSSRWSPTVSFAFLYPKIAQTSFPLKKASSIVPRQLSIKFVMLVKLPHTKALSFNHLPWLKN